MEPLNPPSNFQASLGELRSSLKWLIGSAGAAAAVVVAALQLDEIPTSPLWAAVVVTLAEVLALGVTLALLIAASRVLTLPRLTATEISNREIDSNVLNPKPGDEIQDDVIRWIVERKSYLLGTAENVTALYSDYLSEPLRRLDELATGRSVTWRGRTLDPTSNADREALAAVVTATEARLARIEDAVHYWLSEKSYRNLLGNFTLGGIVFAVSIAVIVLVPALISESDGIPVMEPVPVDVIVQDAHLAGLPSGCAGSLTGVAVGGTLEQPVVALNGSAGCEPRLIEVDEGVVAIPDPDPDADQ